MSPEDILDFALTYERRVTLWEPRQKATAWHAQESCRCCGACVLHGERSTLCPAVLPRESIVLSQQGYGPARNILAFTGGDVLCRPEFYGRCATLVKEKTRLWVLLETNGFGLTADNLDYLRDSGVDAFWLDIKAFDPEKHKWLTGCDNDRILRLPEEILARGFVLEVLSLYIPGLVEADQLSEIARLLARTDRKIPFTILAFFPACNMRDFRSPTVTEMVKAHEQVTAAGLTSVRLGNLGQFIRTDEDLEYLFVHLDRKAF
jgi:pyruvate-formate lyase-activating enzyme